MLHTITKSKIEAHKNEINHYLDIPKERAGFVLTSNNSNFSTLDGDEETMKSNPKRSK